MTRIEEGYDPIDLLLQLANSAGDDMNMSAEPLSINLPYQLRGRAMA
jgi:hypothetical protein